MRDENGNPPLRPIERRSIGARRAVTAGLMAIGAGGLVSLWGLPAFTAAGALVISGAVVAAGSVVGPLAHAARRRRTRTSRASSVIAGARPLVPGEILPGRALVCVQGTCVVLRSVKGPRGVPVAAFASGGARGCGRFAVRMTGGVAVVDDDCFEVFRGAGTGRVGRAGGVLVGGATVEVCGPARHAPVTDATLHAGTPGDRGTREALCFDGSPAEPVLILV